MKAGGRLRRAGLTTALAFLAWTPAAAAQEPIDRSWTGVAGGAQGYRLPPGVVPAIRGFDVGYERSDHQVKLLFMGPVTRSAIDTGDLLVSLQDHDGNDAISGSVRLTDLRGLGRHLDVTRTECPRDCRLRIPHLISSEAFVLTGFAFRLAARGTDRNLLQVKVRQAAHNGYIDVAFVDRAGTAPYFAQVTYAVIPRSLLGPTWSRPAVRDRRAARRSSRARPGWRSFSPSICASSTGTTTSSGSPSI
jgi:hypothetical protein